MVVYFLNKLIFQFAMAILTCLLFFGAISIVTVNSKPDSKTVSQQSSSTTITTPLGSIQGTHLTSRLGKHIFAFRGIRYAKAPIDDLRFQPPVPVQKWEGILNATVDGPACPQPGDIDTSEDCLLLNVYTTKLPKSSENPKRAVMVFFHGGDFVTGSGDSTVLGPKYLLDQDIVLVVPNYRLGIFGFISTNTQEAPGNLALKDQLEALKWVKANILAFGGDPDSVTIAGQGSGAVSVSLHMVSPLSKGLYNKIIAMSGSGLANLPIYTDQIELVHKVAKLVNCTTDPTAQMIKCLKTKTHQELSQTAPKLKEFGLLDPYFTWFPVVEPNLGQEQFLLAHPIALIMKDQMVHVSVLAGITTDEIANHAFALIEDQKLIDSLNEDFDNVAPILFSYERNTEMSRLITKSLQSYYLENKPVDNSSVSQLVRLYADSVVGYGVYRIALTMFDKTNTSAYYYRFNYKGRHSNFYLPNSNSTDPFGVTHGDDLIYLFQNSKKFPEYKDTDPEVATIEKMTIMWSHFVQNGKPIPDEKSEVLDNVQWEPFTHPKRIFMDIGNKLVPSDNLYTERYFEWDKLSSYDQNTKPSPKIHKKLSKLILNTSQ